MIVTIDSSRLPDVGAGFVWDHQFLAVHAPRIRAVFTTRLGGYSTPPYDSLNLSTDTSDVVDHTRNWSVVLNAVGARTVVRPRQVHGTAIVDAPDLRPGLNDTVEADGVLSRPGDDPVAVLTADCMPVLVVSRERMLVVHAGWRGLVSGIIEKAVQAAGDNPTVWIGPCIGGCCYEVGEDVLTPVRESYGSSPITEGNKVELAVAATSAAVAAGAAQVHRAGLCTKCHPELFFSHRRDSGVTGRQGLVARWI